MAVNNGLGLKTRRSTYGDNIVLETFAEHSNNSFLMGLLDDPGGGVEDAERGLAQAGVGGLASLEENAQEFGPLVA